MKRNETRNAYAARMERDRIRKAKAAAERRAAGISVCRRGHVLDGGGLCEKCRPQRRIGEQTYVEAVMNLQAEWETAMPARKAEIEALTEQLHAQWRSQQREKHETMVRSSYGPGRPRLAESLVGALVLWLLCAFLPAQVVHVGNYSGAAFSGWKRCTIDVAAPHEAGLLPDGTRYVQGRRFGVGLRVVDLLVTLQPGEIRTLDLSKSTPAPFARGPLPADPLAFFGAPTIGGSPLQVLDVRGDGAAWLAHLRARSGRMLCTDLWVWWYPDRPGWACGEVVVTASNPAVPDMVETVGDAELRFGAADVLVPGLAWSPTAGARAGGARLLPTGTTVGDGQARSFPLVLIWRQHLNAATEWASAGAAANMAIAANGLARVWPNGNPHASSDVNAFAWVRQHWPGAIERLHSWEAGPLGVVAGSGQTGAQEDQVFVGAELARIEGLGAEQVRYLVALGQSRRPCHHLEVSGAQIEPALHPECIFWSSRPHWHRGVSPDQLGKARGLTELDSHGWSGPDREHWLCRTMTLGARVTGSPALQWQLSQQARNFLLSETVDPRLSTSGPDAARSIGWAGLLVADIWTTLEDRPLAERFAERWRQRVLQVYVPKLGSLAGDIWDPRTGDGRLIAETGMDPNWMPEQQAVGCYGLDLACSLVGPPEGRTLALRGARAVLSRAWVRDGARWVEWERLGFRGAEAVQPIEGRTAHRTGWYRSAWFPLGVATVLRHEPTNAHARTIWAQQLADAAGGGAWFPPEVPK